MHDSFSKYLEKNFDAAANLQAGDLSRFVSGLRAIRDEGGTLWIAGNGGSSAAASHATVDLIKTSTAFRSSPLKSFSLSEMVSLQTALANDISFEQGFSRSIQSLSRAGDGVMILSVSGTSLNLIRAVEAAKEKKLKTFAITGKKGAKTCSGADYGICIPSEDYQIVENIHMLLIHWFTIEIGQG
jgi:D-sedoheptulose 7-phosphate isomerase